MSKADIDTGPEKSYEQRWQEANDALTVAENRARAKELEAGKTILRLKRERDELRMHFDKEMCLRLDDVCQLAAVREALAFYANEDSWLFERLSVRPIDVDRGERARAALSAEAECPQCGGLTSRRRNASDEYDLRPRHKRPR